MAHTPETQAIESAGASLHYVADITETEGSTVAEIDLTGVPVVGRIMLVKVARTAGAGTAIRPVIGDVSTPSAADNSLLWQAGDPADADERPLGVDALVEMPGAGLGVPYFAPTGILYLQAVCAGAATDNALTWQVMIKKGW